MKPIQQNAKFSIRPQASCRYGFTLTELLIVIAIIAALAALTMPVAGYMKRKAQAAESVNRIRQCGIVVLQKAAENNNHLLIHTAGSSSNMHDLRLHGMVQDAVGKQRVGKLVYTPAFESKASGTWPVWAANFDNNPDDGIVWERIWVERGGEQRYLEGLRLAICGAMGRYPLLADSSNSAGVPRARFTNDGQYKFAMRYLGKGPVFFLDGATRLVGQREIANYGITRAYLFNDNPVANPTLVSADVASK